MPHADMTFIPAVYTWPPFPDLAEGFAGSGYIAADTPPPKKSNHLKSQVCEYLIQGFSSSVNILIEGIGTEMYFCEASSSEQEMREGVGGGGPTPSPHYTKPVFWLLSLYPLEICLHFYFMHMTSWGCSCT